MQAGRTRGCGRARGRRAWCAAATALGPRRRKARQQARKKRTPCPSPSRTPRCNPCGASDATSEQHRLQLTILSVIRTGRIDFVKKKTAAAACLLHACVRAPTLRTVRCSGGVPRAIYVVYMLLLCALVITDSHLQKKKYSVAKHIHILGFILQEIIKEESRVPILLSAS